MQWHPHVTVAAVVEREGRYLLVEEATPSGVFINQPAGHWEDDESLLAAVARETMEESGWRFEPQGVLGLYVWRAPQTEKTFLRIAFTGRLIEHMKDAPLDQGIRRVLWLSLAEITQQSVKPRSPLVVQCIQDHQKRAPWPLMLLSEL